MDQTTDLPPNDAVLAGCKHVLKENRRDDYTIPAEGLYPHQWLWDSCFIAIGLAEYDIERAQKELRSLLRGQWSNGMLPHIIFANGDSHKRDRNLWQSWRNPHAPDHVSTSGLTQPPMLAEAIVRVGKKMKLIERRGWYQDMFPALLAYHEWFYRERDPHQEGLALLLHPWESGLDNSPPWINQLMTHHRPWWVTIIEKTRIDKLALLFRRDTLHVPPGQRISNIEAILYFHVMNRLRSKDWDIDRILARSHFVVQDLTFNCIFIRANQHLRDIAKTIGHQLSPELLDNMKRSEDAIEQLWDGFYKEYYSRNFITHKHIKEPSLATLMPLYAGTITKERASELVKLLNTSTQYGSTFPVPSVPISSSWFREYGYWQGPVWLNTNWLIADGLERYGFEKEANHIREGSIELVRQHSPYEYFSPLNGSPAGAKNFSWTAALTIAMLKHKKKEEN